MIGRVSRFACVVALWAIAACEPSTRSGIDAGAIDAAAIDAAEPDAEPPCSDVAATCGPGLDPCCAAGGLSCHPDDDVCCRDLGQSYDAVPEECCSGLATDGLCVGSCRIVTQNCSVGGGGFGPCCDPLACQEIQGTDICCVRPGDMFTNSDLECCSLASTDGVVCD